MRVNFLGVSTGVSDEVYRINDEVIDALIADGFMDDDTLTYGTIALGTLDRTNTYKPFACIPIFEGGGRRTVPNHLATKFNWPTNFAKRLTSTVLAYSEEPMALNDLPVQQILFCYEQTVCIVATTSDFSRETLFTNVVCSHEGCPNTISQHQWLHKGYDFINGPDDVHKVCMDCSCKCPNDDDTCWGSCPNAQSADTILSAL